MAEHDTQNHVENLKRLRSHLVSERREAALAHQGAITPSVFAEKVVALQTQIEVVDRAIQDEGKMKPSGGSSEVLL